MDKKDWKCDTASWQSDISTVLLSYLGNGVCGCNGYCTCNEGFSGDICECGPGATKCSNSVGEEVSSLCVCNVLLFIMQPKAGKLNYIGH